MGGGLVFIYFAVPQLLTSGKKEKAGQCPAQDI